MGRWRGKIPIKERICIVCGKRFLAKMHGKICSKECRKARNRELFKKYNETRETHRYDRGTVYVLDETTWTWKKEER